MFVVGQKVVCKHITSCYDSKRGIYNRDDIDTRPPYRNIFTIDKEYEILEVKTLSGTDSVLVIGDDNQFHNVFASRFEQSLLLAYDPKQQGDKEDDI